MKKKILLRKILGVTLMIVGIVGLVLPFIQGVLFLFLGIYYFNPKLHKKLKKKFMEKIKFRVK